ncbi:MAG: methyl-accepting chemotaxis protein [Candidatus Omnitrophica bacterium]|nr:methyl-accepting chemotaxis protein [Candidatus Omnitrophota bacterium]
MTLNKKMIVGFGTIIAVVLLFGMIVVFLALNMRKNAENLGNTEFVLSQAVDDMQTNMNNTAMEYMSYMIDRSGSHLEGIDGLTENFRKNQIVFRRLAKSEQYEQAISEIDKNYDGFKQVSEEVFNLENIQSTQINTISVEVETISAILKELVEKISNSAEDADTVQKFKHLVEFQDLSGELIISMLMYMSAKSAEDEKQIIRIKEKMLNNLIECEKKHDAKGDENLDEKKLHEEKLHPAIKKLVADVENTVELIKHVKTRQKDMVKAKDNMDMYFLENIKPFIKKQVDRNIKDIEDSSKLIYRLIFLLMPFVVLGSILITMMMLSNFKSIASKLKNYIQEITSSSSEILAAAQQQAAGAREQASAIAETSTSAKELSATSEQVGESINKVADAAKHAMDGMSKLKVSLKKTNDVITSLGEKSEKIGKITGLIDDIADQTNLLAVNASIEAARAGEYGRGFTVVADEIRKLSDSTAASTKEITDLVEIIQHEMTNSIVSMEESVKNVEEETSLAHETSDRSREISMSANQQLSGSRQIAEAMLSIDEAMKQVTASAKQSEVAVKSLSELAREMQLLADKMV